MRTLMTRGATLLAVLTLVVAGAAPAAAANRRYVALALGGEFGCALSAQGRAYCWGRNERGQLGNGGTLDSNVTTHNVGTPVEGSLRYTSIAAGNAFACALTTEGLAYCWGNNERGQLGNGDSGENHKSSAPVPVAGGITFTSIAAGEEFACALTAAGRAYCWGTNSYGQLGNGDSGPGHISSGPVAVKGKLRFASIAAGGLHTCAVTTSGKTYCWGYNNRGQLGNDSSADSPVPVAVVGRHAFAALSLGTISSCALTTSGKAYCWGDNGSGQYGTGGNVSSNVPVVAMGGKRYASISLSTQDSYAQCYGLRSGRLECTGWTDFTAEIGSGVTTPVAMTMRGVSYGVTYYNFCALTSAGEIYCTGSGSGLGDGIGEDSSTPVLVQ
jgi:alpha-tubulin suppressor-like RCC1 family protein